MSDQNAIQEPVNLQELLYVKSLPVLTKMLGPIINGVAAKNYRIVDVKVVNAGTVVVIDITNDVTTDIATATPEQFTTIEVPYNRYDIADVFTHYIGNSVFGGTPPTTLAELKTWLAKLTDRLEIDNTLYVEFGKQYVSIRPKDLKDLKWHGVARLNFTKPSPIDGGGDELESLVAHAGLVNIDDTKPLTVQLKDGTVTDVANTAELISALEGEGYTVTDISTD